VLERRHVIAGQLGAPHRVGQRVLGLDPPVPGSQHRQHLPCAAGQLARRQPGAGLVRDGQLTEHSDTHLDYLLSWRSDPHIGSPART
jgi:hypothetical protein